MKLPSNKRLLKYPHIDSKQIMILFLIFALLSIIFIIPVAHARNASSGEGRFLGAIDWFEWGVSDELIPAEGLTKVNRKQIGNNELVVTCSISNIEGKLAAYRPGDWNGDAFDNLYNIGGTGKSNQLIAGLYTFVDGATVSFDFSCNVTLDGAPVRVQGLVFSDAEASHKSLGEYIEATPNNSATWRIIDRYRKGCDTSVIASLNNAGKLRLSPDGTECAYVSGGGNGPVAVGFMEGATGAKVSMKGGGKSAVALGVVLQADYGDAPASYGEAGALFEPQWTKGEVPVGETAVSGNEFELADFESPTPRLGDLIDADAAMIHSDGADGDDNTGLADEDGLSIDGPIKVFPTATYEVNNVRCVGEGYVNGWIDWNGDGSFSSSERSSTAECTNGIAKLQWTVPDDVVQQTGNNSSYLRLRIAKDKSEIEEPTGMSTSGEVEDYQVAIELPAYSIEKTSDYTADKRPGDTVNYTVTVKNVSNVDFTNKNPLYIIDDLSPLLDDSEYKNDAKASVSGALSYESPKISWVGSLPAGKTVVIGYSVKLKTGGDGILVNEARVGTDPSKIGQVTDVEGTNYAFTRNVMPKLTISKTVDKEVVSQVGETVTYTVKVRNVGLGDYTVSHPATFEDNLTDLLKSSSYNNDATASAGAVNVNNNVLSWSGPLTAGEEISVHYSVTYQNGESTTLHNSACIPTSEASQGSATCATTETNGPKLEMWKTVEQSETPLRPDSLLTYTLHFENSGTATGNVDAYDYLQEVLDDTDFVEDSLITDKLSANIDGNYLQIVGPVEKGQTETVSYQVRARPDQSRNDSVIRNYLLPTKDIAGYESCDFTALRPLCTENAVGTVTFEKRVENTSENYDPGSELVYTIIVKNTGPGEVLVDKYDALDDVLDDATISAIPTVDNTALTVSGIMNSRFHISGVLQSMDEVTITYRVTINAVSQRGNNQANNYLVDSASEKLPEANNCQLCTLTPLPAIKVKKVSLPLTTEPVAPGEQIDYTILLENSGEREGALSYIDDISDVIDDADIVEQPTASTPTILAEIQDSTQIAIEGTLAPQSTGEVTYSAKVKAAEDRNNHILTNYLFPNGEDKAESCANDSENCTSNPVTDLQVSKAVAYGETDSGEVSRGDILGYQISFTNKGAVEEEISYLDDLTDVLDDAQWIGVLKEVDQLNVLKEDKILSIRGSVAPLTQSLLEYSVRVPNEGLVDDATLINYLFPSSAEVPTECEEKSSLCTITPVAKPEEIPVAEPPVKPTQSVPVETPKAVVSASSSSAGSKLAKTGAPILPIFLVAAAALGTAAVLRKRRTK